jgi:hypothetical protein
MFELQVDAFAGKPWALIWVSGKTASQYFNGLEAGLARVADLPEYLFSPIRP